MKNETYKGTIESAYGNILATALKFEGQFEAYETIDELKTANDMPSNDEIVKFVNDKRKANARQKSMQAALDAAGIAKPTLENPEVQFKSMVKILVANGKSETEAKAIASAALGYSE